MDGEIAAILAIDGIASGAIYALIAIGFVLIFAVTRVIFVPFGDIAAFTALTLASLETRQTPGTVGLVAVLAVLATVMETTSLLRERKVERTLSRDLFAGNPVLLCSEFEAEHCHRRIVAEYLAKKWGGIEIEHL